jgi:hypothetical protein
MTFRFLLSIRLVLLKALRRILVHKCQLMRCVGVLLMGYPLYARGYRKDLHLIRQLRD